MLSIDKSVNVLDLYFWLIVAALILLIIIIFIYSFVLSEYKYDMRDNPLDFSYNANQIQNFLMILVIALFLAMSSLLGFVIVRS